MARYKYDIIELTQFVHIDSPIAPINMLRNVVGDETPRGIDLGDGKLIGWSVLAYRKGTRIEEATAEVGVEGGEARMQGPAQGMPETVQKLPGRKKAPVAGTA